MNLLIVSGVGRYIWIRKWIVNLTMSNVRIEKKSVMYVRKISRQ